MPLWIGKTWDCHECGAVNAELRTRCRFCGREWWHPDRDIDAEVATAVANARAADAVAEQQCRADGYVMRDGQGEG